jgi:hypothetical protein
MSAVEPELGGGDGAGAGVGWRVGVRGAWWRRRGFFFFGFFGFLTGAVGGRTADGEMPPVRALPPVLVGVELPDEGAETPPLAADALVVPQAMAITSTAIANAERTGFPPCMGLGIGPHCVAS